MAKSVKLRLTLIGVGLWLAISPFILFNQVGASGSATLMETLIFIAMGFVALALGGLGGKDQIPWRAAAAVVFTAALIAAPSWFEFYANPLAIWNTVIVGMIVLLAALLDIMNRQHVSQFQ